MFKELDCGGVLDKDVSIETRKDYGLVFSSNSNFVYATRSKTLKISEIVKLP